MNKLEGQLADMAASFVDSTFSAAFDDEERNTLKTLVYGLLLKARAVTEEPPEETALKEARRATVNSITGLKLPGDKP